MEHEDHRPDPDALLRGLEAEAERARRPKLKLFFGFAPGVGKTYAMLESARRLRAEGVDVVVGLVETHGRPETAALVQGLEVLPRRSIEHRGRALDEFDLDGALKRAPRVLLVDELAHTNAPGSRHDTRWQDVLALLHHGITAPTTLNVQHVESLNDVIAQVTSIHVRETVPDGLLDRADEIELVDLTPEELIERLRAGKVYLPDQAARAIERFFQPGHLLALRELALRRTADRVEADVQAFREQHDVRATWSATERILVCVGPGPGSARLVRAGRRMAEGLHAPWIAASVEARAAPPISEDGRRRIEAHLRMAESLGAEVVRLSGERVSTAILDYARRHDVTRVVIGKPTHPRIRDLVRGSLVDEIVRGSGEIEVHAILGDEGPAPNEPHQPRDAGIAWKAYASSAALVAATTVAAGLWRNALGLPDVATLYLLAIVVVAVRFGRGPALTAAALSVASDNYFFVPPYHSFAVAELSYMATFFVMLAVSVIVSGLAQRLLRQEKEARIRERRTAALYSFSRALGLSPNVRHVGRVIADRAADVFQRSAAVLVAGERNGLSVLASAGAEPIEIVDIEEAARWAFAHGRPAGLGTDTLAGVRAMCIPLRSASMRPEAARSSCGSAPALGVLVLSAGKNGRPPSDRDFMEAFVRQSELALARARLSEEGQALAVEARAERTWSSLLSLVSFDLREPLRAIAEAESALRDTTIDEARRVSLLDTVRDRTEELDRLVADLVLLIRLDTGTAELDRRPQCVDQLIAHSIARLGERYRGRVFEAELDGVPPVSVDPGLFERALVCLLENATSSPAGAPIEVRAHHGEGVITIEIADRGPGLSPDEEGRVHDGAFPSGSRLELGMSLCKGIVEAHGGVLDAENRPGGGAIYSILVPALASPRAPSPAPAPTAARAEHAAR